MRRMGIIRKNFRMTGVKVAGQMQRFLVDGCRYHTGHAARHSIVDCFDDILKGCFAAGGADLTILIFLRRQRM